MSSAGVVSFKPTAEHPWTSSPASLPTTLSSASDHLSFRNLGKTDWWRTTEEWRSSGASYTLPLGKQLERSKGSELSAGVRLEGDWEIELWLKTGIEFTQGQAWASVVVTNRWSDWSLLPIPTSEPLPLKFSFKLKGPHLRVYLGSMMIREVNGFAADATAEELAHARVGVMGCSPIGEGVQVRFSDFALGWEKA